MKGVECLDLGVNEFGNDGSLENVDFEDLCPSEASVGVSDVALIPLPGVVVISENGMDVLMLSQSSPIST